MCVLLWHRQAPAASCSPNSTKEDVDEFVGRVSDLKGLLNVMALGGRGRPDLPIGVFCYVRPTRSDQASEQEQEEQADRE